MKDIILFSSVFIGAYIVSMGVLYVAFRVFFPVVVEYDEAGLDIQLQPRKQIAKPSRDSGASRMGQRLQDMNKIKLAHG